MKSNGKGHSGSFMTAKAIFHDFHPLPAVLHGGTDNLRTNRMQAGNPNGKIPMKPDSQITGIQFQPSNGSSGGTAMQRNQKRRQRS